MAGSPTPSPLAREIDSSKSSGSICTTFLDRPELVASPNPIDLPKEPTADASSRRQLSQRESHITTSRSSVACLTCQERKIRCDTFVTGIPCRNSIHSEDGPAAPRKRRRTISQMSSMRSTDKSNEDRSARYERIVTRGAVERFSGLDEPSNTSKKEDANAAGEDASRQSHAKTSGLVQSFCQYVYCQVPVVDLRMVLPWLQSELPAKAIALTDPFLLNAILLTGSMFASDKILMDAGFKSRDDAFVDFYDKAKSMYNSNRKVELESCLQALLLIAFACLDRDHEKADPNWIKLAVSLSYRAGLNRSPDEETLRRSSGNLERLWKRMWWSCHLIDRLASLRHHRRPYIYQGSWSVSQSELADLELDNLEPIVDAVSLQISGQSFVNMARLGESSVCNELVTGKSVEPSSNMLYSKIHRKYGEDYETALLHTMFGAATGHYF